MFTSHTMIPLDELEQNAKEMLDKPIYDYIAGGAGSEFGMINNRLAYQGYYIVPRILQDVRTIDTSCKMLGEHLISPIMIGPCAFHKLVCEDGELTTARASNQVQTIMTLSSSIEDLFACPQLTDDERTWFFELNQEEQKILVSNISMAVKVDAIIRLGYYEESTAIIFPSIGLESFGLVMTEAMAHARAIIGINRGTTAWLVEDNHTGLLFDPSKKGDLAEKILSLAENTALAKTLGKQGYEKLKAMIDNEDLLNQIMMTYQACLAPSK